MQQYALCTCMKMQLFKTWEDVNGIFFKSTCTHAFTNFKMSSDITISINSPSRFLCYNLFRKIRATASLKLEINDFCVLNCRLITLIILINYTGNINNSLADALLKVLELDVVDALNTIFKSS